MKTCRYGVYEKIDEKPTVAHVQYCKECGNCIEECPNGCISFRVVTPKKQTKSF